MYHEFMAAGWLLGDDDKPGQKSGRDRGLARLPTVGNRCARCSASCRIQVMERGHSSKPLSQSAGMPVAPSVAPAMPPTAAPVESASPPRPITSSMAARKFAGFRNQQYRAKATV